MGKEKIVMLKLYSGDMLLGKKEEECEKPGASVVALKDPRIVALASTMSGSVRVALGPVCGPFDVKRLRDALDVQKSQIMFELSEDEIEGELLNGYRSDVSGIKIATAADAAAIAGTPAPGKFEM